MSAEERFWAKVDRMEHDGDLWLSPSGSSVAWDEPKIEVAGAGKGWQFYRLDFNRNAVVAKNVDVEALGRKLGVLAPYEYLRAREG